MIAVRTSASPQPPSVLLGLSGGYGLLVGIATTATNEGPSGWPTDTASTASHGWNTDVAEASNDTRGTASGLFDPKFQRASRNVFLPSMQSRNGQDG